jgi:iron complex outermembrane recepter protein
MGSHHFTIKLSVLCCLSALSLNIQADDEVVELKQIEVLSEQVAPASNGLLAEEHEKNLTPGGANIIDMSTVTEGQVSNLGDMLRYVPGVWAVSGTGNDNIFFSSRGSNLDSTDYDNNGIKLLQDGLSVTAADGNNHNRFIDPLSARFAVFARGANAMKYGASTLGGAINFITPTAYELDPITFSVSGGSFGQLQTRLTASQVFNDAVDAAITIEDKHWDGYRDHNKQDRTGVYANAGLRLTDNVSTRFYFTHLNNDQELTSALTKAQVKQDRDQAGGTASKNAGNFQLNVDTWRLANKTKWDIDQNRSLEFGVSYEEQKLFHPIVFSPFYSLLIDNTQRNLGTMVRYNQKIDNHDLLIGMNYGVTHVDGGNYSQIAGKKTARDERNDNEAYSLELFAMDRWQFAQDWTLIAGAQTVSADRDVKVTALSDGSVTQTKDDYNSINPRLGLIYQLSQDTSLYTNLSRLYEAPTLYQLDDGENKGIALDAMKGEVFEIGGRGDQLLSHNNKWGWDVSAYYARLRDEILSTDDPNAPGTSITGNVDNTIHAGIEALLNAEFALDDAGHHRLTPLISLSWNHFKFNNDELYGDNYLPAAPKLSLRSEVMYRNNTGFYAGPTMEFVGDRYVDFANTYKISSHTLFGLKAGWSDEHLKVFAEVRNLFDRDYIATHSVSVLDPAEADPAVLNPGAPVSAYLGFEYRM